MNTEEKQYQGLIGLIPAEVRRKIGDLPVVEAGYGAGPGFVAVQRWQYDPPVSLDRAIEELERYRERMRRCHIEFQDGTRLVMERYQFLSFDPSIGLRKKHAASFGPDGVIRERFRFNDYDEWPDTLARDIDTFKHVYSIAPNVLAASREVFVEMDEAVQSQRDMVVNEHGEHPPEDEAFELSGFTVDAVEVEFVLTETTPAPEYMLIFDPHPEFDGEPVIIPGTSVSARTRREESA